MTSYEKRTWWTLHRMSDRLTDDTFLEAAINAAFLIAASDGAQSEVEYDALLDRLELLGGVDRDAIDEKLADAARALEETDVATRIAHIATLIGDDGAGHAVLVLALAIALADDEVTDDERKTAEELAVAMSVDTGILDETLAMLRG